MTAKNNGFPRDAAGGFLLVKISRSSYNPTMNPTVESSAFDRAVTPVLRQVMPASQKPTEVSISADPTLAKRIEELASKSSEGALTEKERDEYHGYVRANQFIATLQRQLRRILNSPA